MPVIAPSLLACNFLRLEEECKMVNESEAGWFHLDVMDGRFVPNISFGLPVISQISKVAKKFMDVHLMILEPEKYAADFAKAGAQLLTVHIEACPHLHRNIQQIHDLGMQAGVAINPHTPVSLLADVLPMIDVVLIMSVNPGFGGQKFIHHTYQKTRDLKQMIIQQGANTLIEIDGGVTTDNAGELFEAGADVLVAGNTVFSSADPKGTISKLLQAGSKLHEA